MKLKPHTLYWALTDNCQLRCRYCFYQTGITPRHGVSLPRQDCDRLISDIAQHFQRLVLTGGEPAIHPYLEPLARQAKQLGLEFGIVTNGYALDKQIFEQVLVPYADIVNVSLDALDSGTQAWLRPSGQRDGYPETLYEGLERLVEKRADFQRVNILQTITRKNIREIEKVSDYCRANNLTHYVHPVGGPGKEPQNCEIALTDTTPSERKQLAAALDLWAAGGTMERRYGSWIVNMCEGRRPEEIRCRMGSDILFLDVDASLYPCFYRRDVLMGSLKKNTLGNVLSNPSERFVRSQHQLEEAGCFKINCLCFVQQDKNPNSSLYNTMSA